jgi:hypothetical protein
VVEVVELALDIFKENNILFEKRISKYYFENRPDTTGWSITNLVKNAIIHTKYKAQAN